MGWRGRERGKICELARLVVTEQERSRSKRDLEGLRGSKANQRTREGTSSKAAELRKWVGLGCWVCQPGRVFVDRLLARSPQRGAE